MPDALGAINVLQSERAAIVGALKAGGIESFDHIPARFAPPCALVAASDPYIARESDNTFGDLTARFDIRLIVPNSENRRETKELDVLIQTAAVALHGDNFTVDRVDRPIMLETTGAAKFLSVNITITSPINLK